MNLLQIPFIQGGSSSAPTDSLAAKTERELTALKNLSVDDLISRVAHDIVQFAIHLAIAILVFYVGKAIIKKIYQLVETIMVKRRIDGSLTTFTLSLVRMVLYFILIVTVISILGIETSSFIAIFASAGVAIGMALSGTLQNFAGGVLILLLKPYKIGDYIEAQGFNGTVTEIQIFNTIISTPDNKSIIIPNGGLSTGTINNWSRQDYRRVEWTVGISYGNDVDSARQAILAMMTDDKQIVQTSIQDHRNMMAEITEEQKEAQQETEQPEEEPEKKRGAIYRFFHRHKTNAQAKIQTLDEPIVPITIKQFETLDRKPSVNVGALADSSVNLTVRAWVPSSAFWEVYYRYNERFYKELPIHGVDFPFPQLDVHINPQQTAPQPAKES